MEVRRLLMQRTVILLLGLTSLALSQTCDSRNYTLIDQPERSVCNTETNGLLCDSLLDGAQWYRFSSTTGDTIVERAANDPVPVQRCGTTAPIYIRGLGSHPDNFYTTTDATVCANYGGGDTCAWNATIQIYRCLVQGDPSDYFLYRIKPAPGCPLSYCVGWIGSCDQCNYWNGSSCVREYNLV